MTIEGRIGGYFGNGSADVRFDFESEEARRYQSASGVWVAICKFVMMGLLRGINVNAGLAAPEPSLELDTLRKVKNGNSIEITRQAQYSE